MNIQMRKQNFIDVYTCEHIADDHVCIAVPVKLLGITLEKRAPSG